MTTMPSLIFNNNIITLDQIRKILYRMQEVDGLEEPKMKVERLSSERRISEKLAFGNFQVGCTITIENDSTYYLFCAANTLLDKPSHVTIGQEKNGAIFLISEKLSNITTFDNTIACASRNFFILYGDDIYDRNIHEFDNSIMPIDTREDFLQITLRAICKFKAYFDSKQGTIENPQKGNQKQLIGYNSVNNKIGRGAKVCLRA